MPHLARPGATVEEDCEPTTDEEGSPIGGCPLLKTKPGSEPASIAWSLNRANQIERRAKMGRRINQLNELTPMEWAAGEGLQVGHQRWQEVLDQRMKEKANES